jgi:acetyl esterase/lipase
MAASSVLNPLSIIDLATSRRGYRLQADLSYGPDASQAFDIYWPQTGAGPWPLLIFLHGGRWTHGSRKQYRFVGQAFARHGIAAAVCGYRTWPGVRFPGFVEDAATAIAALQQQAEQLGADPNRIVLCGHSAGAHIAALLVTGTNYLEDAGGSREGIAGMIGMSGPYDFLPIKDEDLLDIFGPNDTHHASQPISFVDGREPSMLLLHGGKDKSVSPRNSKKLAQAVQERGGHAQVVMYPWLNHTRTVGGLATRLTWLLGPVLEDCVGFVNKQR